MNVDNTTRLVVDAMWVTLNEGKKLHPRVDREKMKEEITSSVKAALGKEVDEVV